MASTSDPIDLTQEPIDIMLTVINAANPSLPNGPFTVDNLQIGTPEAIAQDDPETDPNTELTIRAIPGKGYRGSTHVTYNRIDLAEYAKTTLDVVTVEASVFKGDTFAEVLDYLNNVLLLQIDSEHISNLETPVDLDTGTATLEVVDTSLIFQGELEVDIVSGTQTSLSTALSTTYIQDTFVLPEAI